MGSTTFAVIITKSILCLFEKGEHSNTKNMRPMLLWSPIFHKLKIR